MIYVSIALLALGTLVAIGNIGGSVSAMMRRRKGIERGYSSVPLISLLCCVGAWGFARPSIGFWAFIPTILDPGTWMLLALPGAIIDRFKNPPKKTEPEVRQVSSEAAPSAPPDEPPT